MPAIMPPTRPTSVGQWPKISRVGVHNHFHVSRTSTAAETQIGATAGRGSRRAAAAVTAGRDSAQRRQQEHEDHWLPAQASADQGHQRHIPKTQRFDAEYPLHEICRGPAKGDSKRLVTQESGEAEGQSVQVRRVFYPVRDVRAFNRMQLVPIDPDLHELHIADARRCRDTDENSGQRDLIGNEILIEVDRRGRHQKGDERVMIEQPPVSPVNRASLGDPLGTRNQCSDGPEQSSVYDPAVVSTTVAFAQPASRRSPWLSWTTIFADQRATRAPTAMPSGRNAATCRHAWPRVTNRNRASLMIFG